MEGENALKQIFFYIGCIHAQFIKVNQEGKYKGKPYKCNNWSKLFAEKKLLIRPQKEPH